MTAWGPLSISAFTHRFQQKLPTLRKLVTASDGGYAVVPASADLVAYYAESLALPDAEAPPKLPRLLLLATTRWHGT